MNVGVLDAGVAIGWIQGTHRSFPRIQRLLAASRAGRVRLILSVVNLAEVLRVTADIARSAGVDPVVLLRAAGVVVDEPSESIGRRVAKLRTSLADGFAAATAQEYGARLHTTDGQLVGQLRQSGIAITKY